MWSCLLVLCAAVVQARLGKMGMNLHRRSKKDGLHFFAALTPPPSPPGHNHAGSTCSTWGRGHYKTFDGDVYQFPGLCEYNLVSDCHESYQEFSVHIRRKILNGSPTVSHLVVSINQKSFRLSQNRLTVNGILWVPASCRGDYVFL